MRQDPQSSERPFPLWFAIAILAAFAVPVAIAALACRSFPNLARSKTEWVELSEDDLLSILQEQTAGLDQQESLLSDITRVDIQKFQADVTGAYSRPDGTRAEGSYLLGVGVKDGELLVDVFGIYHIDGAPDESQLGPLEQSIQAGLVQAIAQGKEGVRFEWAGFEPDLLRVKISTR